MLGQIEAVIHQRIAVLGDIGRKDSHLAVFYLPQSTAILASHPYGIHAFLLEPTFVENDGAIWMCKVLAYHFTILI